MDFDRLARQHKDAVYRQMYRMCGNHEDAEDVLSEALMKAYRSADGLSSEETFRAWLAQIARRTCGRLKKRENLRPVLSLGSIEGSGFEPTDEAPTQTELVAEAEMKECVLRAFAALPPMYAEVYEARDIQELSAEETAKKLGITVAAVKSRLHRARAMVRDRIDASLA